LQLQASFVRCVIPDERAGLQDRTTGYSLPTDCRDAGCPDDEVCEQGIDEDSAHYACVCPDGFERDADTRRCQPIAKSG